MRNPPRRRQCRRACPILGFFAFVGRFWITWTRLCQNCSNKFDARQKRPEKPEQKLWKDQWIKATATRDAHVAQTANPSSRDVCTNISLQPVTATGTLPASGLISSKQFVRTKQNENLLKQLAAGAKKKKKEPVNTAEPLAAFSARYFHPEPVCSYLEQSCPSLAIWWRQ